MSANSRLIQGRFRLKSFRGKKNLQHPLHGLDSLAGGLQELLQQLPSDSGRHFLDVSPAALRNWWSKCNITAPARRFYGGDEPLVRFWSFKSWDKSEVSWNLWIFWMSVTLMEADESSVSSCWAWNLFLRPNEEYCNMHHAQTLLSMSSRCCLVKLDQCADHPNVFKSKSQKNKRRSIRDPSQSMPCSQASEILRNASAAAVAPSLACWIGWRINVQSVTGLSSLICKATFSNFIFFLSFPVPQGTTSSGTSCV